MDQNIKICTSHPKEYIMCKVCGCIVDPPNRKRSISDPCEKLDSASKDSDSKDSRESSSDDSILSNITYTFVSSPEGSRDRIYSSDDSETYNMHFCSMCGSFRDTMVTQMPEIVKEISSEIQDLRDKLLFSSRMGNYDVGTYLYRAQERYEITPLVSQLNDGVLMDACPTGGCFKLGRIDQGGCCGGGNVPEVFIRFAMEYRRTIGDEKFNAALKQFNGGKEIEPWYFNTRTYQREFTDLGGAKKTRKRIGRVF